MIAGSYRVEEEIGRGGMAVVYRAFDTRHEREVAVKTLLPDVTAALGAERFLREIRLAAQLNHPHIVPLYDSGAAEGLLYYVMPLIAGRTLREHMSRKGRLQPAEALKIAGQVASALDYAHRRGVVHRDIKPENILLHEGEAMVTDFGIAMALSNISGARLTQTGLALGTPAYMSPEQGAGEGEVDGRSDQYSLACVVYEMLTGEPPFVAPSPQALIAKRFTHKPQSVRVIIPAISGSVARAVDRALSLEVGNRFTTAAEFGAALAQPAQREAETEKPTIAVLPFVNMSTDAEQEFFSDGVTEEIINSLSKVQGLQVVSRRSVFAWKGKDIDTRSIGAQLGASSLVEGTVRRSGSKLRVSAELIDVENGLQLWSARYDREMAEIFAIQDEIASSIVKALRVVLSDRERITMKAPRTNSVRAYEYYLRGRQLFRSFRRAAFRLAEDQFRHAISFDPDFAQAYAGLADVAAYRHIYFSAEPEAVEQADTASRKAVELDPGLAEAHASRGLALFSGDKYDEAEQEFRQAMELDPTLFEAPYYYARLFHLRGQGEDAVRYYAIAAGLRPDDYQANCLAAGLYLAMGRTTEALDASRRGATAVERALAADPSDTRALYLGAGVLYNLDRVEEAGQLARRAVEMDPDDPGMMYNVACFFAIAGMKDEAIGLLERAADLGWNRAEWARNDVDFTSIRKEERFTRLMARMDAAAEATTKNLGS